MCYACLSHYKHLATWLVMPSFLSSSRRRAERLLPRAGPGVRSAGDDAVVGERAHAGRGPGHGGGVRHPALRGPVPHVHDLPEKLQAASGQADCQSRGNPGLCVCVCSSFFSIASSRRPR